VTKPKGSRVAGGDPVHPRDAAGHWIPRAPAAPPDGGPPPAPPAPPAPRVRARSAAAVPPAPPPPAPPSGGILGRLWRDGLGALRR